MKISLSFILIIFCSLTVLGQKIEEKSADAAQQIILRKQILADEFDNQTKNIPFAAVRVYVRTKLAEWLWRDGKDDTGRAEQIAIKAVEELYEKKDEIPNPEALKTSLFSLLEINANETAKKLRAKYSVESREDLMNSISLLDKEGGDKIVGDKIKKYLTEKQDLGQLGILLVRMEMKKSPELLPILAEIVSLEETGRNNFSATSLFWVTNYFRNPAVPDDLKIRFYKIVLKKAKNALESVEPRDVVFADSLLDMILPDITAKAPELLVEASPLRSALAARNSHRTREGEERDRRIQESADKLGTMISEADKTDNKREKYSLWNSASYLAMKEGKFQLAVDLLEKTIEDKNSEGLPKLELRLTQHDQRLGLIVQEALKKNDADSAFYALKKIVNGLKKADALRFIAIYFHEKKDSVSALNAYEESLKITAKADADALKFNTLIRLIPVAHTLDVSRIPEIISITVKAIDSLPTLKVEDKPETENFKNYVTTIMAVNYNLYPVMINLTKLNKNEATGFASRINRKEVKIIADLALAIEAIEAEKKLAKSN